jgi:hypothetical protein
MNRIAVAQELVKLAKELAAKNCVAKFFNKNQVTQGIDRVEIDALHSHPKMVDELASLGYKSFKMMVYPHFGEVEVWMVPLKNSSGEFQMTPDDVEKAYRQSLLIEKSESELDREEQQREWLDKPLPYEEYEREMKHHRASVLSGKRATGRQAVAQELVKLAKEIQAADEVEVIVDLLSMETTEDSYEEGEVGRRQSVLAERNFGVFKSMREAIHKASSFTGIPEKNFYVFSGEDGRIEADGLVDEENNYVGDDNRFIDKWKMGEVKAWNADVSLYVRLAKTWTPTDDELVKLSGLRKD